MNESLLNRILKDHKRRTRSLAMILCLSMIVSLGTFAGFHQTAIAKVYTREVLDCPYAREGAEPVAHVHNDDCYEGETLVCTLPEREAHTHDDTCYAESRLLNCGLEENPGHQHSEACFDENGELICQIPEGEGAHSHTEECYTIERALVCNQPELNVHVHDAGCFRTEEITVDEPEEAIETEQTVSSVPEMPVSDPNADLETSDDWNREFENLELSGNWARDLVLVAATQQGRGESPNNFEAVLNDAGDAWVRHGYTRYGAWYGYPYAEWDAMFVSFCLRYAGIPAENVPNNPTAALMAESFSMGELFAGRDYVPAVGDLIFFDTIDDEITNIDHMGIVYHVDAENGTINTVEGDRTDAVATFGYYLNDEQIVGYGILPQNPDYIPVEGEIEEEIENEFDGFIFMTTDEEEETPAADEVTVPAVPMPAQSWERTAGGIKVTVDAPEGAFPENTRIAVTPVNGNSLKDTVSDAVSGEVLEVQAVDITFFDASGREIEPAVPIRVVMTPAATENAEEKTSVVHVDVAQQTAELVEQAEGTETDNSEVVFDAEAFTIYAIVYTVDFEYEVDGQVWYYSLEGGQNIALETVLRVLNVCNDTDSEYFMKNIADVRFSDESLVRVVREGDTWVLQSLQPFNSVESLTITMKDGQVFEIRMTDEQQPGYENLAEKATGGLNFNVVDKADNTATYNTSTQTYNLQLKLDFTIPSDYIKDGHKKYDLEFASDVTIPQDYLNRQYSAYDSITGEESFKYTLVNDNGTYHMLVEFTDAYVNGMKDSGRTIGKNTATLDISVGKETLQEDGSLKINVIDNKDVTVTPDKITYPEGTDGQHDLSVVKKYGGYDKTTNKMKYTLVVSSKLGTAGEITVSDVLSVLNGSDVTVSNLSVTSVKTGTGNENYLDNVTTDVTGYTATPATDNKSLTITLPQAVAETSLDPNSKTIYLVEYEYTLSGVGDDFEANGKNSVTATSGNITSNGEAWWNISQAGIALGKNGQYNADAGTITWTIDVTNNKDTSIPLQDDAFKDIDFSALTITPNDLTASDYDQASGTLTISAGKSYTITYTTTAAIPDATVATNVTNTVTAGNPGEGQKTTSPSVSVPAETSIDKKLVSTSRNGNDGILTWRVKIHVPSTGFAAGTTFTEKLGFTQDYNGFNDMAYLTGAQETALVNAFKACFGDSLVEESYTPASKTDDGYGNTIRTAAELVMKLNAAWPGENPSPDYRGKDIYIEYQTSANLNELHSDNNVYTNTFLLNDLSKSAEYSFKDRVVKMSSPNNAADVTTAEVDSENNKLHWYIQVALEEDATSVSVTDTLPEGLTVTSIRMGNGPYNLVGLMNNGDGTWAGETAEDWRNGVPAWNSTYMNGTTPSATVDGQTVAISLTANGSAPDYLEENSIFYFYIEAEINSDQFPAVGAVEKSYTNTATVTVNNTSYGSDDQTQNVTLKTSLIDKTGDSSVWNAQNGAHELSYAVDINPSGGTIADQNGEISLTDRVEYYKTVKDNMGNSHKVSLNLKEGSVKLQRKDSNGQWVDIPATEGWGYTLDENVATSSDNIKAKELQVYGIPDNMPLRFVYTYNVEVEGLAKNASVNLGAIKNTAILKAIVEESSSHTESKDWKNISSSASTESTGSMTVVKVQEGNYAITLPDTLFVLEKFVPAESNVDSEGSWQAVNAVGSSVQGTGDYASYTVYKTNSNGKLIISADPAALGTENSFAYDTLYRVREYEPHEGYTLDGLSPEAVYFYFGQNVTESNRATALAGFNFSGGSKHADDLLRETDTVYMTNQRVTDTITARKQWNSTTLWPNDIIEITMELQKGGVRVETPSSYSVEHDGKYYTADDTSYSNPWTNPQTLTASDPQAAWEKLDIDTTATNPFAGYRIVETSIRYDDSGTGVELNRISLGNDQYQWKVGSDGEVLFETFGGKVTNGMGTIVNMSKTKLDVAKSWGTQQLGNNSAIEVVMTLVKEERLYARNGVLETVLANWQNEFEPVEGVNPIVLNGETDSIEKTAWNASFENLDRFRFDESTGRLYEIRYSVQEQVRENGRDITDHYLASLAYSKGNTPITDNNTEYDKVTVTNADNVGELLVHKNWQRRALQEGETELPALPDSIYISIERYYEDGDGTQHNDDEFNADHKGIQIVETDIYVKDSSNTYTWAKLFENLQRHIIVDGTKYDYVYVVREDTMSGFTTVYSNTTTVLPDTNQVPEVTITNVEKEERHEEDDIDIQLKKYFADKNGDIQATIPEGVSATFRLYRCVTVERGIYDMITNATTKETEEKKTEDELFNTPELDGQWSRTVTSSDQVKVDNDSKQFLTASWSDLPIVEIYYRDGTYTKYTYEYYLVETSASNSTNSQISYIAAYISENGSNSSPITLTSIAELEEPDGEQNKTSIVEVKNVESTKSFTIRKYWILLNEDAMPGVVVTLERQHLNNGNPEGNWENVSTFGVSTNGANIEKSTEFTLDSDGSKVQGYLLNSSNEWNITFNNLADGYQYRVTEVGYYDVNDNGDYVVKSLESEGFRSEHYRFTSEEHASFDQNNKTAGELESSFGTAGSVGGEKGNIQKQNYGTMFIGNISDRNYAMTLLKKWFTFSKETGQANITDSYTGKLDDGSGEGGAIVMQLYQRAYWAFGTHKGEWASDWTKYRNPITIYKDHNNAASESGFVEVETNSWYITLQGQNFAKFGYELNTDGEYELVYYDYKWVEEGMIPGSDGRTFRSYVPTDEGAPENRKENESYYQDHARVEPVNWETGPLEIIKQWKEGTTRANKVFFTVTSTNPGREDVAKQVYESDPKYYGLLARNVTYLKDIDKYVFVMGAEDDWDLIVRGLDIVTDPSVAPEDFTEVNYTVEEVAIENSQGTIIPVSDTKFPYTATYYKNVKGEGEQLVGNTASGNENGGSMVASGLQIDNAKNDITHVRVVNSDEPTTQLTVQKKWPDDKYPGASVKVVLNLQQRRQATNEAGVPLWADDEETIPQWNGEWQAAEGTTRVSVTLPMAGYSGANAWTYTWKGLPIYKVTGYSGTENETHDILWYRVVETSAPGWTSSTLSVSGGTNVVGSGDDASGTGDKTNPITQVLTNSIDNTDVHIEKQWTNLYADDSDKSDNWSEDHTINWPEGYAVSYKVVRHAWVLSATDGETTTVNYVEDPTREPDAPTSYEQKNVSYTNAFEVEDWKQDPYMEGQLSAANPSYDLTGLPKGAVITTDDNPPAELAMNTTYVVEYVYEVVETAIVTPNGTQTVNLPVSPVEKDDKGNYIKDDGVVKGDAIITNDLTNIEVQKIWSDGEANHTNETVTVQLYKSSQRPEGVVPVENGKITIYVSDMDDKGRTDMDQGKIIVTVTGDDGSSHEYELTAPSWSVTTGDLPETAAGTGNPINYTVTVKSVDGSVIESASVTENATVNVGENVTLSASAVEPPKAFTLNFNLSWIKSWDSWDATSAPTKDAASIDVKLKYNDTEETLTLNNANGWGASLDKQLNVLDSSGNKIQYTLEAVGKQDTYIYEVNRNNSLTPTSFTGDDATDNSIMASMTCVVQAPVPETGEIYFNGTIYSVGAGNTVTLNYSYQSWASGYNVEAKFGPYQWYNYSATETLNENEGSVTFTLPSNSGSYLVLSGDTWKIASSSLSYATVNMAPARRTMKAAAPKKAPSVSNKSFTILGTGDKTPLDAVEIGTPITLYDGKWHYEWENLPTTDENGNPIYYYVRETSASLDSSTTSVSTSYEYVKHDDTDAKRGYAVVKVTNTTTREEPQYGSVKVTKAFVGLPDGTLPTDFKITNSVNGTEFTVSNKEGGSGTAADPYYWTIDNLTLGTEVTFTESGYDVAGYAVATVPAADATTKAVQATATSATTPGVASFSNTYTKKVRDFEFNKIWLPMTANLNSFTASDQQTWPTGAEITVEITRSNDTNFKLTYKLNGTATEFEPETIAGTTLTKDQLKLVKTGDKDYNFKLESAVLEAVYVDGTEEKAYVYTVKETNSPTDYAAKHYGKKESDAWKYKQDMVNGAGNGEVIINQETGGYELPSTGGSGTWAYTILGSILILGAGVMLWRRRRLI